MEIFITIIIVLLSLYFIYANLKKSKNSGCNCSNCNKKCSKRKY